MGIPLLTERRETCVAVFFFVFFFYFFLLISDKMNSTWAFIVVAMLMAAAHAAPLAQDSADDDDDDAIMNQILKRDADFRQDGFLGDVWNGIKTVASNAGQAALKALGEKEKAMLLKEIQELEKKNVRLNDAVLSRQNGVLANLWNGFKTVASDAGKAALKALWRKKKRCC